MKVCFISLKAYPLFNHNLNAMHGGAEVQMSILAKLLSENNAFDVNMITADYHQPPVEKFNNITIWRSFNFKLFTLFKIIKFFHIFNKVNADVYIQRTLSFYSFFLAAYCKLIHKKFIYMVAHDNELNGQEVLYKYPFGKLLVKMLFKSAAAVIVQNQFQVNLFKERFHNKNLFELKKIIESADLTPTEVHQASYDCVWLARAESWKQPVMFLKLADLNPNKRFLMVCPCLSQSYSIRSYKNLVAQVNERSNVTFITHLPYLSISVILNKCKVYCSTSSSEGDLPMSLLEAAAAGLPLLLLSINNYNAASDEDIGIFCHNDIEKMNIGLNKLLDDAALFTQYKEKALSYIEKYHNKDIIVPQFIQILKKVSKKQ